MNLCEYRKQAGLTQEQLAEKVGVSVTAISNWETGVNPPKNENLKILSRLYDVPVDELFRLTTGQKEKKNETEVTSNFPVCLFRFSDDEYIKQLVFSEHETELIRLVTVCSDKYGILDIGGVKDYDPTILSKLPGWYYDQPNINFMTTNKDLFSIWNKLNFNNSFSKKDDYIYYTVQEFIIKYLFEDFRGQCVKEFNVLSLNKYDLIKLSDSILNAGQKEENDHSSYDSAYVPCLSDIYNICYHINNGTFSIKDFVKNYCDKYRHGKSYGETLYGSDIQNWIDITMKPNLDPRPNSGFIPSEGPGWYDSDWNLGLTDKGMEILNYLSKWKEHYTDEKPQEAREGE